MISNTKARFIAWLLRYANARQSVDSRAFYDLKDRLLKTHGSRDGSDLQHIVDRCWGYYDEPCSAHCGKCGGTGLFRERWIELERWSIGGAVFHRPSRTLFGVSVDTAREFARNIIEDRIEHRDVSYRTSSEARLWLYLLFDRRLWWHTLTRSRNCGWQWRPMLALQVIVASVRFWICDHTRRCVDCRRKYFFLRPPRQNAWWHCSPCTAALLQADQLDADLPF